MTETINEKPIIFDANEVNAVLAGCKTQHRVPILTSEQISAGYEWDFGADGDAAIFYKYENDGISIEKTLLIDCPFGAIGDQLWVQEDWTTNSMFDNEPLANLSRVISINYIADSKDIRTGRFRKAEDMHRIASRLLLEITDIRIERVNDITHSDSIAEYCFNFGEKKKQCIPPLTGFCSYWREKHGDDAWRSNPWVWVIEFKVAGDNKIYPQKDSGHGN